MHEVRRVSSRDFMISASSAAAAPDPSTSTLKAPTDAASVGVNQPLNKTVRTTAKMMSVSVRPVRDLIRLQPGKMLGRGRSRDGGGR
jgi:hypothetical protein